MELIERYVHHVGAELPKKIREDVKAELRSLLMDALEQRSAEVGRPPDEEMAVEVLKRFGKPEAAAARYRPQTSLIGPAWFPYFKWWALVVLSIQAAGYAAWYVLSLQPSDVDLPRRLASLGEAISDFFPKAMLNLGWLVVVFAVLERVLGSDDDEKQSDWNPRELEAVEDRDRIEAGNFVFALYATVGLAVIFNFYPSWVPLLRPEYEDYLWLMNFWWAGAFALNLTVLKEGRWRRATRWGEFALGVSGCALTYIILTGEPIFHKLGRFSPNVALKIVLIISLIDNGLRLYRLLTRNWNAPWQAQQVV